MRRLVGVGASAGVAMLAWAATAHGWRQAVLALIGVLLGVVLYQSRFSFAGAYRAMISHGDVRGFRAHLGMVALATVMFGLLFATAPLLDWQIHPARAPLGLPVLLGSFIFGIGMQLGGGCGSGSLVAAGGGNLRLWITLVAFCVGGFWASLHWPFWAALPSFGPVVLGESFGWPGAVLLQAALVALLWRLLARTDSDTDDRRDGRVGALAYPWPLVSGAVLLAVLNSATLVVAGGPWSITWGFTLIAAKAMAAAGWSPEGHDFWQDEFQAAALASPLLSDAVVVMDLGLLLGAAASAVAAGRLERPSLPRPGPVAAALLGGLLLGYGARVSFGCNIGAFFSGAASTSLHGWLWLVGALAGTWAGTRLRPLFGLGA